MDIEDIIKENSILKQEINLLKEHLKKYTAPSRSKTYYENHKEELLDKMKKYLPTPEKIKETNRKAYLKRKEKEKKNTEIIQLDKNDK